MDLVLELEAHGFPAVPGQCFAVSLEVYLDFMGQLLETVRKLPDGAAFQVAFPGWPGGAGPTGPLHKQPRDRPSFTV